jgi:hypothetical protein
MAKRISPYFRNCDVKEPLRKEFTSHLTLTSHPLAPVSEAAFVLSGDPLPFPSPTSTSTEYKYHLRYRSAHVLCIVITVEVGGCDKYFAIASVHASELSLAGSRATAHYLFYNSINFAHSPIAIMSTGRTLPKKTNPLLTPENTPSRTDSLQCGAFTDHPANVILQTLSWSADGGWDRQICKPNLAQSALTMRPRQNTWVCSTMRISGHLCQRT